MKGQTLTTILERLSGRSHDTPPSPKGQDQPTAGTMRVVSWRPGADRKASSPTDNPVSARDRVAAVALWVAGTVIAAVIVGGAIVVYTAQYQFAVAHNGGDETVAHIQAAIPDAVWIAMSALGLSQALRGKSSLRATSAIVVFFALSLGAQLLHAEQTPEGYLVAAITPVALALMLEALLHGVRHWALARDGYEAPSRPLIVRILLGLVAVLLMPWAWLLRLALDPRQTASGMREWLLDSIPYAPGRTLAQDKAAKAIEQAGTAAATVKETRGALTAAQDQAAAALEQARQEADLRAAAERRVQELTAERRESQAALARASEAAEELQEVLRMLPARQQVEHLYARLGRRGDPRHGDLAYIAEIAEELRAEGVTAEASTVVRYLREAITKFGTESHGASSATPATIGGGA